MGVFSLNTSVGYNHALRTQLNTPRQVTRILGIMVMKRPNENWREVMFHRCSAKVL